MINALELIWPAEQKRTAKDLKDQADEEARDLAAIRTRSWTSDTDAVLEEARRLTEAESDRRKIADGKAATYLTVVSALVPILTSFAPSIWDTKWSLARRLVSLPPLLLAIVYLIGAGVWAFLTLRVSVTHRVDPTDLVGIWGKPKPKQALVAELLCAVRMNYAPVNSKVTRIKLTDAFLMRAFIVFASLLLLQVAWPPLADTVSASKLQASKGKTTTTQPVKIGRSPDQPVVPSPSAATSLPALPEPSPPPSAIPASTPSTEIPKEKGAPAMGHRKARRGPVCRAAPSPDAKQ